MGDTTIPGGSGVTDHHILPLFGVGADGHRGITQGMGGGLRSFGGAAAAGASHGHTGSANVGSGSHRFGDHGGGQIRGERFGQHNQSGFGHDTINLGSGHDTLVDAGRAAGTHFGFHIANHSATMAGGAHHTNFIGAHSLISPGASSDSHTGGATMVHGTAGHLTALFADHKIGTDVIKTFVTGHDKLYVAGQSLAYLHSHVDVTVTHGATVMSLHGGHTTIALKGFAHMSSTDTTHKA